MADSKNLIPFIRKWEGGFSDHPRDKGGPTQWGVTIATYTAFRKRKGYPDTTAADLKAMTETEWHEIFKSLYWDRWKADRIENQSIANILVDWVWASGVHGIKIPQRILGVTPDGIVGPITLAALNAREAGELFDRLKKARIDFIDDLVCRKPDQQCFAQGWNNRIANLTFKP